MRESAELVQHNLYPAVLRHANTVASRNQWLTFATGIDDDVFLWNTIGDQAALNGIGPTAGQTVIVTGTTGTIRVTCNINPGNRNFAGSGCGVTDDLLAIGADGSAVKVKED